MTKDLNINARGTAFQVCRATLLVEGLGVCAGGRNTGVTGSLLGSSGELELVGSLEVGIVGSAEGGGGTCFPSRRDSRITNSPSNST